jgi:glutathione S-transferase
MGCSSDREPPPSPLSHAAAGVTSAARVTVPPSVKLYDSAFSPNCLRVRAVAHELDIELELKAVDVFKGENATEWFRALNPNGKVPVLQDGDFVLWESRAITSYLAAQRPDRGLHPSEAKARALVDQWSYWQAIHLGPAMQKIAFERVLKRRFGRGEPDEAAIAEQLKEVDRCLRVLDQALLSSAWVAADTITVADFAVASTFVLREPAAIGLDAVPRVADWIARLESRPSWARAVEPMLALSRG